MASATDQIYFPPLDDCLVGKHILVSWRLVASAISDPTTGRLVSPAVADFLKDPYVHQFIKKPGQIFGPKSCESTNEFKVKTAAIHATPTPNPQLDIHQIKSDAEWLSAAAGINEVAALRIVVLESQNRPHSRLRGPLSRQDVANIQEAAGLGGSQASGFLCSLHASPAEDADRIWSEFEKEEARRQRLVATYLSERRHFMMTMDCLITFLLHNQDGFEGPEVVSIHTLLLRECFGIDAQSLTMTSFEDLVPSYMQVLPECMNKAQEGPAKSMSTAKVTPELEMDWYKTHLTEAIHAMSLIFQVLDVAARLFATPETVSRWFRFVADYAFLDQFGRPDELDLPLRSLVCVISLLLLNLSRSLAYLEREIDLQDDEDPFLDSPETLVEIHTILSGAAELNLATASPVVFAWSLIVRQLYLGYQQRAEHRDHIQNQRAQDGFELENQSHGGARRNSAGSIVSMEQSTYDLFLTTSNLERDIAPIERLAAIASNGWQVHEVMTAMSSCMGFGAGAAFRPLVGSRMRLIFLGLLKHDYFLVGYQAEPVECLLSLLAGGEQCGHQTEKVPLQPSQTVAAAVLADQQLLECYVVQALRRYPYEFVPFVRLCRQLVTCLERDEGRQSLAKILTTTPSLTMQLPEGWVDYELVQEEDNANTFQLLGDLPLFSQSLACNKRTDDEEAFVVPRGTLGRFVAESTDSRVALLEYEHSTLALLGKRLEASLPLGGRHVQLGLLQPDEVVEAILLLSAMVRSEGCKSGDSEVLAEASRGLPHPKDILSIICDKLDFLVQGEVASASASDASTLSACLGFLHAALAIEPGRVWSYMARCELLSSDFRAAWLSKITGSLDLVAERFELVMSATKLFSDLVGSAMTSAVQRRVVPQSSGRHKAIEHAWLGISDKMLSGVCAAIAATVLDVLENTTRWSFQTEVHRSILTRDVVKILHDMTLYSYSIGGADPTSSLTACFVPAATGVVKGFLAPASSSRKYQALLESLLVALHVPDQTLYLYGPAVVSQRVVAVLAFLDTMLGVAKQLDRPSVAMQSQLFQSTAVVARLCGLSDSYRSPSYALLASLVESAGRQDGEPPSLLGYLGSPTCRSFLQLLSLMDKPLCRPRETMRTWRLFAVIVRNRQRWMANCLLTGRTPREALQRQDKTVRLPPDSVLATALARIKSLGSIPSTEALPILDFVTSAQNYWPWTVFALHTDGRFVDDLRRYVRNLAPAALALKTDAREAANQVRMAAYIAEAFAMQLYHLRHVGQAQALARDVVRDADYYLRDGVHAGAYNSSLHVNFARNFSGRYPACSLDYFKRTMLRPKELGPEYYYALDFAEAMMSFDAGWIGPRHRGFKHEMQMANLNLSLVDAQVSLFHSWEYLLLELSMCLLPHKPVVKQMLQVAQKCLEANQEAVGPASIFIRLRNARATLCLTLLRRLADHSLLPKDITRLLGSIWTTVSSLDDPFSQDMMVYYRILLRILFIVLRASSHSAKSDAGGVVKAPSRPATENSVTVAQLVLNILDRVVSQGFRTLVGLVHEADAAIIPDDMALITAILQACVSLPGMDQCQTQILNLMAAQDVFHLAISLFSWADRLAIKGDPVYGELAVLFLLELSVLPVLAEQLAANGLLGHLTSANLAAFMRRPNVSPFAEHAGAARCYCIWAKGILPLLLHNLGALGPTIAREVVYVLNQFPNLLASSVERLEAPGMSRTASLAAAAGGSDKAASMNRFVTLVAVSEAHSLALLCKALAVLRDCNMRDVPAVRWDAERMLENVETWLGCRKVLRERIVPLGSAEAAWKGEKPLVADVGGSENRLEEKIVLGLEAVKDVLSDHADEA